MKTDISKRKTKNKVHLAVFGNCSGCHFCVNVCPEHAISENTPPIIDSSFCTRCMKCVKACPRDLIKPID